jgi:hypothetical protein
MVKDAATAKKAGTIPERAINVIVAILAASAVEFLIAILRPLLPLWTSPLQEIWMNIFEFRTWTGSVNALGAGFLFFAFVGALIVGATWLHGWGTGFEERLSSREAKISFVLTIIVFGVFFEPRLKLDSEKTGHSERVNKAPARR